MSEVVYATKQDLNDTGLALRQDMQAMAAELRAEMRAGFDELTELIGNFMAHVDHRFNALEADVRDLRKDVNVLKKDVAELKDDVAELKVDVEQLKADNQQIFGFMSTVTKRQEIDAAERMIMQRQISQLMNG